MYSLVLATMMMAGGETTGFCHKYCHGCYSSCHGCWGGGWGCHCWGGHLYFCSGYSGCWSCYSGWAQVGCYSCWSCHGSYCYSGCYSYGCSGYYCSFSPYSAIVVPGWACSGCGVPVQGVPVQPNQPNQPEQPTPPKMTQAAPGTTGQPVSLNANRAQITVTLPADAKLWVDDVYCPLTSESRTFNTPALQPGTQYFYIFKMEQERDGKRVSENRRVVLSAGQQINVNFNVPATELQTVQR